jgi:hypothetical protein
MLRINPSKFGGLKFETDSGIGQKGTFCNGFSCRYPQTHTKLAEFKTDSCYGLQDGLYSLLMFEITGQASLWHY